MDSQRLDERISELERDRELLEQVYQMSLERMEGKDETWSKWRARAVERICTALLAVKVDDEPHKVVAVVNRLISVAEEMTAPKRQVDEYDRVTKTLMELEARRDRQTLAFQRAQEEYDKGVAKRNRASSGR